MVISYVCSLNFVQLQGKHVFLDFYLKAQQQEKVSEDFKCDSTDRAPFQTELEDFYVESPHVRHLALGSGCVIMDTQVVCNGTAAFSAFIFHEIQNS